MPTGLEILQFVQKVPTRTTILSPPPIAPSPLPSANSCPPACLAALPVPHYSMPMRAQRHTFTHLSQCTVHIMVLLTAAEVHFLLLMAMTGSWAGGRDVAGAAVLAVEEVNANKTLLPGHVLGYSWADSGCSAQQGLKAMGELLGGASRIDAVIGPGCSSACEVTSYLSGGQNLPQISWGVRPSRSHTHVPMHSHACMCCGAVCISGAF